MTDPALMSLTEVAAAIRDGAVSSVDATEACLARIEAHEGQINSIINLERAEVLESAKAADAARDRGDAMGPLHGVPLAHKDMYYRRGHISTCGSTIRRNYVPDITATVLEKLEAAGALYVAGSTCRSSPPDRPAITSISATAATRGTATISPAARPAVPARQPRRASSTARWGRTRAVRCACPPRCAAWSV